LVRETYPDSALAAALNERFIPVRLEGRSHMDLVQKYQVRGAPSTIIFSPEGVELHRFSGFHGPQEFLIELAKAG